MQLFDYLKTLHHLASDQVHGIFTHARCYVTSRNNFIIMSREPATRISRDDVGPRYHTTRLDA